MSKWNAEKVKTEQTAVDQKDLVAHQRKTRLKEERQVERGKRSTRVQRGVINLNELGRVHRVGYACLTHQNADMTN